MYLTVFFILFSTPTRKNYKNHSFLVHGLYKRHSLQDSALINRLKLSCVPYRERSLFQIVWVENILPALYIRPLWHHLFPNQYLEQSWLPTLSFLQTAHERPAIHQFELAVKNLLLFCRTRESQVTWVREGRPMLSPLLILLLKQQAG